MLLRIAFLTFAYVAVSCSLVAIVALTSAREPTVSASLEKTGRLSGAQGAPAFVMERFAG